MDISGLTIELAPITAQHTIDEVGELFLLPSYKAYLSLPVVDEERRPIGMISRYELMKIYLKRYGRELYGKQSVTQVMNTTPLVVDALKPLEEAAHFINENIHLPLTEDFIITQDGRYQGVGVVLDLLSAMERQLNRRTQELGKAYRHLKSSQSQLVQSEKMASLGQMVAGVAHEINTPLGYVRNNVEMSQGFFEQARRLVMSYDSLLGVLLDEEAEVEEGWLESHLNEVQSLRAPFTDDDMFQEMQALFGDSLYGVDQIADLVSNLKDFSRLDQAKLADVNLNECLDSTLVIANNVLKHKADVVKKYSDIPPVRCSPSQINQVFLNLFTNAAQAITAERGVLQLQTQADDKFVYVQIQDNGKGMPQAVMKKIFDPFFTTKPVGEGTGLGLSISYKIIQQHHGNIRVASKEGKGTRFVISLPRQMPAAAAS